MITFLLIVFLNTQQFLVDVGELWASRVWVERVIYMLSATGLNFSAAEKCSSRNCSYGQVVNGSHLKWLPNKLWSRGCEVIFYLYVVFYYENDFSSFLQWLAECGFWLTSARQGLISSSSWHLQTVSLKSIWFEQLRKEQKWKSQTFFFTKQIKVSCSTVEPQCAVKETVWLGLSYLQSILLLTIN